MNLREKLERFQLEKKYNQYPGLNFKQILLDEDLTENENNVSDSVLKQSAVPYDQIVRTKKRDDLCFWIKEKISFFLDKGHNIIIYDGYYGIEANITNVENFLDYYLEKENTLDVVIINRTLKKYLVVYAEEYYMQFFVKDV